MTFEQQLNYWTHMLDEAFDKTLMTECKHWPQDYEKTFINLIKVSNVYQNIYYKNDEIMMTDVHNFILDIDPHAYEEGRRVDNMLLSYFSTLCRWFIEKSINRTLYQQFMEVLLPECIRRLKALDKTEEKLMREKLKAGSYEDFIKLTDEALDKVEKTDAEKMTGFQTKDNGYQLIKIDSYNQLNKMFGGTKTGAARREIDGWCHTNGISTYDTWVKTHNGQFVILCKKNWEVIKPTPEKEDAFDEYGTSAIALLVNKTTGELVKATLRYNHVVAPPNGLIDNAVTGYGQLSEIAGFDVKQKIIDMLDIDASKFANWTDFMYKYFDGTNVDCSRAEITSLEGAPLEVGGSFDCSRTKITSLEGAPQKVGGFFDCSETNITSLEDAPLKVDGGFYCYNTNITSLEGAPLEVGKYFYCYNTKIPQVQIKAYKEFLKHPTPEHIDETGHYKP